MQGVQIDLELYVNDSNIFLFGTPDKTTSVGKKIPTLEDNDIFVTLWMKNVTLNASVYTRLQKERSLSKTKKVQYPVVRSEIKPYSFDGNSTQWAQDNVFVNRVPGKVIIGLMNSTNYHGSLQHYPFAYQKFGVTRVRQTIDGEEYAYRSLELTGNTKAEYLVGYGRFLTASGAYKHNKIPMMRPGDWDKAKIAPCSCSTMFQAMPMTLSTEISDSQAMSAMKLTSGQRSVKTLPWTSYQPFPKRES